MTDDTVKPLNWTPAPQVGYMVVRRPDGGMHFTFIDVSHSTLEHWRTFALDHLLDSDRLTRNLYDLRALTSVTPEAVQYALEIAGDPAARNVRAAIIVSSETVRQTIREMAALSSNPGAEINIFVSITEAEDWLNRPLTLMA